MIENVLSFIVCCDDISADSVSISSNFSIIAIDELLIAPDKSQSSIVNIFRKQEKEIQ
jgi:hypothetical protein